jgi:hypothetical protein
MAHGDFIHIADVGAMIGDCGMIRSLLERRVNDGKVFKELPPKRDSLDCRQLAAPIDQIRKWAKTNNMNEMSVNSVIPLLFAAALEYEDINDKLLAIFTRINLYMGDNVTENKEYLRGLVDNVNEPRRQQEEAQKRRMEKDKDKKLGFSKQIAEISNRLESRKLKFIRSLYKMLETYGTYDRLTTSDRQGIKFLHSVGWVEIVDNNVKIHEVEILGSKENESFGIFRQLKSHIEGSTVE